MHGNPFRSAPSPSLLSYPSLQLPLCPMLRVGKSPWLLELSVMASLQPGEGAPEDQPIFYSPHGTDHQDVNGGSGLQPTQLHAELIATRISTLGFSDEEDGVPLPIPHAHTTGIQGTAIMCPSGSRFGFALRNGDKAVSSPRRSLDSPPQFHMVT